MMRASYSFASTNLVSHIRSSLSVIVTCAGLLLLCYAAELGRKPEDLSQRFVLRGDRDHEVEVSLTNHEGSLNMHAVAVSQFEHEFVFDFGHALVEIRTDFSEQTSYFEPAGEPLTPADRALLELVQEELYRALPDDQELHTELEHGLMERIRTVQRLPLGRDLRPLSALHSSFGHGALPGLTSAAFAR